MIWKEKLFILIDTIVLQSNVVSIYEFKIPGSPFQFTVGPITDGGAHKVRAIGQGLERGEVNKPGQFILKGLYLYSRYTVSGLLLKKCVGF